MTSILQVKRRLFGGVSGAPGTGVEGELALNFAKGNGKKPELYAHGGAIGWQLVNPDVSVTTQSIGLPAGTDIGSAYTAWAAVPGNTLTGSIIIASFGSPAQAYVLTNSAAPGVVSSWTSLGGATVFASQPQVNTGTDTVGAINAATLRGTSVAAPTGGAGPVSGDADRLVRLGSGGTISDMFIPKLTSADAAVLQAGVAVNAFMTAAGLRAATVQTSAGAADHDKLPRLDATGKIDPSMLPANASRLAGTIDPTAAPPTGASAPKAGDMYFAQPGGVANAGFTGIAGQTIGAGDTMIFDGTKWYSLANDVDLSAYVPIAGTTLMTGAIRYAGAADNQKGNIIYDGKGGTLDAVLLDMGTY